MVSIGLKLSAISTPCVSIQRVPPPPNGSSPALNVCGGAERGIPLAPGFFTGESTWNPPSILEANFRFDIKRLQEQPAG